MIFAMVLLVAASCKKPEDPVVRDIEVGSLTVSAAGTWARASVEATLPGKLSARLYVSRSADMTGATTWTAEKTITADAPYNFSFDVTGLEKHTDYWCYAEVYNLYYTPVQSDTVKFTTKDPPEGAIDGLFTINSIGDQVYFSQGNLQYQASTNTWRFATNQWDYVGEDNANISSSYSGWIDLFGWGTSGYSHGATCYQPWSTSQNYSDYYAYGSDTYNLYDQTGQADWGYNAISNGGNTQHLWRTLTKDEWAYIFDKRSTPSGIRYAKATVNGVSGVILVPDGWSASTYSLSNTNNDEAYFSSNTMSQSVWTSTLEPAGCVFLPAAGYRNGTSVFDVGIYGSYWSASCYGSSGAYSVYFYDGSLSPASSNFRRNGYCVRLVAGCE